MKKPKLKYKGKIGKLIKYSGCTHTQQRYWTKEEEKFLLYNTKTYSLSEISECLGRTEQSVALKHKRLNKILIGKNVPNIPEKYESNDIFIDIIQPKTVLDLFAGEKSYYKKFKNIDVVGNDLYYKNNEYQMDSDKLLLKLNYEGKKFDLVDIDPFKSVFEYIELGIRLAKKGFILTYNDFGHRRYSRLDYVKNRYNINTIKEFTIDHVINETCKIALRYKKKLTVMQILNSKEMTYRVYFMIEKAPKKSTFKLNSL